MSASDTTTTSAEEHEQVGADRAVAEGVDAATARPERVRNVPRIVSENVATSRLRFQTRSIPRRSCTSTEWM